MPLCSHKSTSVILFYWQTSDLNTWHLSFGLFIGSKHRIVQPLNFPLWLILLLFSSLIPFQTHTLYTPTWLLCPSSDTKLLWIPLRQKYMDKGIFSIKFHRPGRNYLSAFIALILRPPLSPHLKCTFLEIDDFTLPCPDANVICVCIYSGEVCLLHNYVYGWQRVFKLIC